MRIIESIGSLCLTCKGKGYWEQSTYHFVGNLNTRNHETVSQENTCRTAR